ncbi:MAG TPA: SpoIIE family protein phosphatase [Nocardioidaceae bacterium]|nr:SpoIIE family protein phosphatase [Nocardioidaceae bacterium]
MPSTPAPQTSDSSSVRLMLRADRMLAQHRLLLEQVAVDAPLPDVLHRLVRVIEEQASDGLTASILVADDEGRLRHGAAPSLPDAYNDQIDGLRIGPAAGSCGTAAHRREPVIVADTEVDALWADYRELARAAGVRACWSTPLLYGGELLGTFAMYYPEARVPSEEDRETAAMYARTATLAIQRHRVELARDQALAAEAGYARKLARLAAVSLQLAGAETVEDLVRIVIEEGADMVGADGCAIGFLRDEGAALRLVLSESLDARHQERYARVSLTEDLPVPTATRTRSKVVLPDVASGLAFSPAMAEIYAQTHLRASATVPMVSGGEALGALSLLWADERAFTRTDLDFIDGLAAQVTQSLQRVLGRMAQRRAAVTDQRMSEALQRSLLTRPPQTDRLSIAVRYQPAMQQAQIGGDWYDAFCTATGSLTLVVGDVNGHDRDAAAAMGQLRSLLRGLAYDSDDAPADLLRRLDLALRGLELDSLATAVVAQVHRQAQSEAVRLTWSNAGHPPPLLRTADGAVRVLDGEPDLLLGLAAETSRHDGEVELDEGSTLLLYTDGLIENRDEHLDEGIARLSAHLAERGDLPLEDLCDEIVRHMLPDDGGEDDVALLAVRPRVEAERATDGARAIGGETQTMAIENDPAAVHRAREFVDAACRDVALPGDVRGNAVLLTSELVTNSVVHARTGAELAVSTDGSRVRVEVKDGHRALPRVGDPADDATGGRGLVLVQLLATRWDTEERDGGKAVWFELDAD